VPRSPALTLAAVVAAPLLLVWPLRAHLFGRPDMIDQFLSTAVVQHGRELVERFGTDDRQVTRAGFVVPGRMLNIAFGDIGGFYALRYLLVLLAVAAVYVFFARLHGRAAGAVGAATVIASPVLVKSWSTDYPMASVISYLAAGYCCLFMPAANRRTQLLWTAAGGFFLSLALYSHAIALSVVCVALLVFVVAKLQRSWTILVDLGVLLGAFAACSVALSIGSWLLFGVPDLWGPTIDAAGELRDSVMVDVFHSDTWRWVLDTPHVVVPVFVLLVWGLLALRRRNGFVRSERLVAIVLALQFFVFVMLQFSQDSWIIEFHYYFSMLWPAVCLVFASTLCELGRAVMSEPGRRWLPAAIVLAVPVVIGLFPQVGFGLVTALVLAVLAALAIFSLGPPARAGRAVLAIVGFTVVAYAITIAQPADAPLRAGQANLPKPYYDQVFGTSDRLDRDRYAIASELDELVPPPPADDVPLIIWGNEDWSAQANQAAAQYGWLPNTIFGLPELSDDDIARIQAVEPDVIVSLAADPTAIRDGMTALEAAFPGGRVVATRTLRHGDVALEVGVFETGLVAAA
jgi:hypothetical protein